VQLLQTALTIKHSKARASAAAKTRVESGYEAA